MGRRRGERDREKERFWRRLMARQGRLGLSVREFCQREGLKESAFYFWRRELARRDAEAAAPGRLAPRTRRDETGRRPRAASLPVVIVPGRTGIAFAGIEVRLPSGITLCIGSDVDAATLGMVLQAVRGYGRGQKEIFNGLLV